VFTLARVPGERIDDRITRETALLGLRVTAHDRMWHAALDDLHRDVEAWVAEQRGRPAGAPERACQAIGRLALASSFVVGLMGCDPVPPSMAEGTGGGPSGGQAGATGFGGFAWSSGQAGAAGTGGFVSSGGQAGVAGSSGGFFSDPLPLTGGRGVGGAASGGRAGTGGYVVDCAPTAMDPASAERASSGALVGYWRNTTTRGVRRSGDLPLFDPPAVKLESRVEGDAVHVTLSSSEESLTVRWECEGTVEGEGRQVVWHPASADDALAVAVRGVGGIAVASLRASHVPLRPTEG
jgi:hypothetical protein